MTAPAGQHDYSGIHLTRHALERFLERFWDGAPSAVPVAEADLRAALGQARRLGRNPVNGAVAVLAAYRDRMLIAIVRGYACTTVLTWPQFEPRLSEFGRARLPRKRGRLLRRLIKPPPAEES